MLKRRVIPRLDIRDGRVVKGVHFRGMRDPMDPVEAARTYDRQGADEICFRNLSTSPEGMAKFVSLVRRVAPQIFMPITAGGGVRREEDCRHLLTAGADKVAVNSGAVVAPKMIMRLADRYGSQALVAAVDVHQMPPRESDPGPVYEVMIDGATRSTGLDAIRWCEQVAELGAGELLLTSVDAEMERKGYDLELSRTVARRINIPLLINGGVRSLEHLREGLELGESDAVLGGSIFHYGLYTITQAKQFLHESGIPVRLTA